jgi:hypothetical protein
MSIGVILDAVIAKLEAKPPDDDQCLGFYIRQLHAGGWRVAVHNDYRQDGAEMTFWLFTHPTGRWIKGEGASDLEAVRAAYDSKCVAIGVPGESP